MRNGDQPLSNRYAGSRLYRRKVCDEVRLLVAEDDAALRSVLDRGLQENGYVVDAVSDGESAVKHL
jgi:ActR/RegA family two-component response regulator